MPKIIPVELKSKANEMKLNGFTNIEISKETGLSLDWCKKNLKESSRVIRDEYEKLYEKSKRNTGVSKKEIVSDLNLKELPEQERVRKLQKTVRRVRANNKKNLVRPNWMHPNFAESITNSVIESSMVLEERCHEQALELHYKMKISCNKEQELHLPTVQQIKSVISGLTSASIEHRVGSTAKLQSWLDSLHKTAQELCNRNKQESLPSDIVVGCDADDFSDLEDFMY